MANNDKPVQSACLFDKYISDPSSEDKFYASEISRPCIIFTPFVETGS